MLSRILSSQREVSVLPPGLIEPPTDKERCPTATGRLQALTVLLNIYGTSRPPVSCWTLEARHIAYGAPLMHRFKRYIHPILTNFRMCKRCQTMPIKKRTPGHYRPVSDPQTEGSMFWLPPVARTLNHTC